MSTLLSECQKLSRVEAAEEGEEKTVEIDKNVLSQT
jgi:hypothetical protein